MRQRCLEVIGMAVVILAVSGLLKLAPVTVAGQAPTATAQSGAAANTAPAPRTSWGEPDLQGIWRDDYQIPLQRPARYANQEFFTDEERAALDEQRLAVSRFGDVGLAPRGTEQGCWRRLQRRLHVAEAHGPADVDDCGSAGWENASPHARGAEEEGRNRGVSARPLTGHRCLQE